MFLLDMSLVHSYQTSSFQFQGMHFQLIILLGFYCSLVDFGALKDVISSRIMYPVYCNIIVLCDH